MAEWPVDVEARNSLRRIADDLRGGTSGTPVTVRTLLGWFGASRRGVVIIENIRQALAAAGLGTAPDIEAAHIDAPLVFHLSSGSDADAATMPLPPTVRSGTAAPSGALQVHAVDPVYAEPAYRLSRLRAATNSPVRVPPDATLKEAISLMLISDFSQLPVMTSERSLKGIISWRTIGKRYATGSDPQFIRDAMEPAAVMDDRASLFDAIPAIAKDDYVLVKAADHSITGIVTASDLSLEFRTLAEPFLLLGSIENHLRRVIHGQFSVGELQLAKDPADTDRTISSAANLSFGEYVRLLDHEQRWEKSRIPLHRETFIAHLQRVRRIRNDVMHFDPDGIDEESLRHLRTLAGAFQELSDMGTS